MNTAATLVARLPRPRLAQLLDRLALRAGIALVAWSTRERRLPPTHAEVTALRHERAHLEDRERRTALQRLPR
ncbi:hypothetical protein EDF54_2737 [Rathayibacter sp. PhB93]|uniref:hypothetical protein n=1 Tax=unclassified Rathayibacter TaxID=2609250 RepID=UPI000F470F0F|nr:MULTISPECIES: hypothetical protein [unclassified Rathayibacter]ROQ04528.1 hypothetical protein EDF54_2737 [Rathayibacter sp. PhB93]TDQ13366.1 hypothetical protein EDF17_1972 [Rathayibacter sp. PhB1]